MSANPSIKEGNTPRLFGGVKKLLTNLNGGGTALWVPESERQLTTKSINKNGVYQASKDGAYGWSSVYVSVPQTASVTGKGQDGKQHTISTDPSTGMLEDEVTPVSIAITTPPTKLVYTDGEAIDFTGAVVHKYDSDGEDLGTVPLGEITLNPAAASYNQDNEIYIDGDIVAEFINRFSSEPVMVWGGNKIYIGKPIGTHSTRGTIYTAIPEFNYDIPEDRESFENTIATVYDSKLYYASCNDKNTSIFLVCEDQETNYDFILSGGSDSSWDRLYDDKIQYDLPVSPYLPSGTPDGTIQSSQTITVSWPRTGDGAVLETTFDITVQQQSFGGASGGGGQTSGGGAGRD